MGRTVYIETYGCQMNVADTAMIERLLEDAGHRVVPSAEEADVVLVNTCTVRGHAKERVEGRLRSLLALRRTRPQLVLGMLGCVAQHEGERIWEDLPFLDLVVGPDGYRRMPELIERASSQRDGRVLDVALNRKETYGDLAPGLRWGGPRAFVTVQRGCDHWCTYCIVPRVRGRERAVAPDTVLAQVREQVAAGYRDVTLLGQTVNSYRHGSTTFAELLRLVAQVDGVARVRFLSPHPVDFSDELIQVMATEPTVMPHLHLPVQSGSTTMLERMRRRHTREQYLDLVARVCAAVPDVALTTDIMVGFSGESAAEHEDTLSLLRAVRFHSAYMYRYSEREGTIAARRMADDVPDAVKGARLAEVIELQHRITREVFERYTGRTLELLVEGPARRDPADALTSAPQGLPVVVRGRGAEAPGQLVRGRVTGTTGQTLIAEPVS